MEEKQNLSEEDINQVMTNAFHKNFGGHRKNKVRILKKL